MSFLPFTIDEKPLVGKAGKAEVERHGFFCLSTLGSCHLESHSGKFFPEGKVMAVLLPSG